MPWRLEQEDFMDRCSTSNDILAIQIEINNCNNLRHKMSHNHYCLLDNLRHGMSHNYYCLLDT